MVRAGAAKSEEVLETDCRQREPGLTGPYCFIRQKLTQVSKSTSEVVKVEKIGLVAIRNKFEVIGLGAHKHKFEVIGLVAIPERHFLGKTTRYDQIQISMKTLYQHENPFKQNPFGGMIVYSGRSEGKNTKT